MVPTSRGVTHHHVRRACLRIPWMLTLVVDSRDRDRIDTIRIPIEVALVPLVPSVSSRKDEHRPLPSPPFVDTIQHGLPNDIGRTLHLGTVISGTPAAAVERYVLVTVVERDGFVCGGNATRENTNTRDLGLIGDTNPTSLIFDPSDLACAASPMVVALLFGVG